MPHKEKKKAEPLAPARKQSQVRSSTESDQRSSRRVAICINVPQRQASVHDSEDHRDFSQRERDAIQHERLTRQREKENCRLAHEARQRERDVFQQERDARELEREFAKEDCELEKELERGALQQERCALQSGTYARERGQELKGDNCYCTQGIMRDYRLYEVDVRPQDNTVSQVEQDLLEYTQRRDRNTDQRGRDEYQQIIDAQIRSCQPDIDAQKRSCQPDIDAHRRSYQQHIDAQRCSCQPLKNAQKGSCQPGIGAQKYSCQMYIDTHRRSCQPHIDAQRRPYQPDIGAQRCTCQPSTGAQRRSFQNDIDTQKRSCVPEQKLEREHCHCEQRIMKDSRQGAVDARLLGTSITSRQENEAERDHHKRFMNMAQQETDERLPGRDAQRRTEHPEFGSWCLEHSFSQGHTFHLLPVEQLTRTVAHMGTMAVSDQHPEGKSVNILNSVTVQNNFFMTSKSTSDK